MNCTLVEIITVSSSVYHYIPQAFTRKMNAFHQNFSVFQLLRTYVSEFRHIVYSAHSIIHRVFGVLQETTQRKYYCVRWMRSQQDRNTALSSLRPSIRDDCQHLARFSLLFTSIRTLHIFFGCFSKALSSHCIVNRTRLLLHKDRVLFQFPCGSKQSFRRYKRSR